MEERERVINKIIGSILEEMEEEGKGNLTSIYAKLIGLIFEEMKEEGKGNLTSIYAIELLEEAIAKIESRALMNPVRHFIED